MEHNSAKSNVVERQMLIKKTGDNQSQRMTNEFDDLQPKAGIGADTVEKSQRMTNEFDDLQPKAGIGADTVEESQRMTNEFDDLQPKAGIGADTVEESQRMTNEFDDLQPRAGIGADTVEESQRMTNEFDDLQPKAGIGADTVEESQRMTNEFDDLQPKAGIGADSVEESPNEPPTAALLDTLYNGQTLRSMLYDQINETIDIRHMSHNGIQWRPETMTRVIHLYYPHFLDFHNHVVDTLKVYGEWQTPLVTKFTVKGGFIMPKDPIDAMWEIGIEQLDSLARWFWPLENGWTMCCLFTHKKDMNDLVTYTDAQSYIGVLNKSEIQFASPHLEKFRRVKLENKPIYDIIEEEEEEEDIFIDLEEDEIQDITSQKHQLWSQDINIPSTQILLKNKIELKTIEKQQLNPWELHLKHLDDNFVDPVDEVAPRRTAPRRTTPRTKTRSNSFKITPPLKKQKPRTIWFPTNKTYTISEELFNYVYDKDTEQFDKFKFLHRKDSMGIELDVFFPGCVIYVVREPYVGNKEIVIQAYCSHVGCRKIKLCATPGNVRTYHIWVNQIDPVHKQPIARQLRRYERDQKQEKLVNKTATEVRNEDIKQSNKELVELGSYDRVMSKEVYQVARHQTLRAQDNDADDYEDLVKMRDTTDFISHLLEKGEFGVYIHNKSQHAVLHKLHLKREKDKVPIVCRLDATGNLARALKYVIGQLLYYALTVNVTIKQDHTSSPLPLTEQFNIGHKSKDIAMWLFQFLLTHYEYYDNAPLLIDFIITDFSYANMHAILFALNGTTLSKYLNATYEWIQVKLVDGEFPEGYNVWTKIRMCFTHLMHTFADMCKRHYGKTPEHKQVKESKIILEILAAMIKAVNYSNILKLWKQLSILISNEFENDHVLNAISEVSSIIEDEVELDDYAEERFKFAVDVGKLPENQHTTLYASNRFYLEFVRIKNENKYVYGNVQTQKNPYYNPKFLDKFLTRFVPLIPMWTSVLVKDIKEFPLPDITVMQVGNNQPIECYFGFLKNTIRAKQISLGRPPIKIGRAIKTSRELIDPLIQSIDYCIPKDCLNTQKPRKQKASRSSSQSSKGSHSDEVASQSSKPSRPCSQSSNRSKSTKVADEVAHKLNDGIDDELADDVFANGLNDELADDVFANGLNNELADDVFANGLNNELADDVFANGLNNELVDDVLPDTNEDVIVTTSDAVVTRFKLSRTKVPDGIVTTSTAVLNSNAVVTRSKSRTKVPDCVGGTNKDIDNDPSLFINAKESFKKRHRLPCSYFQHHRISKAGKAAKVVKEKDTKAVAVYRSSGLFKDTHLYSDLNFDLVVASKNEMFLHNHEFDALKSAEISPALMKYLLETVRSDNIQIELENSVYIVEKPKVTVQLNKKTILLLLFKDDKWILFILNKDKQTFATFDPYNSENYFFSTFLKFLKIHNAKFKITNEEQWKEVSFQYETLNALNSSDSGIYVYHYIMQYLNTGTVIKSNFSPQDLRDQLRNKVLQFSDDMRNACLICGVADDDRMVECTKCFRWLHGDCICVDVSKISLEDIIHCPMCTN